MTWNKHEVIKMFEICDLASYIYIFFKIRHNKFSNCWRYWKYIILQLK